MGPVLDRTDLVSIGGSCNVFKIISEASHSHPIDKYTVTVLEKESPERRKKGVSMIKNDKLVVHPFTLLTHH